MRLTVQLKLTPTREQAALLRQTLQRANEAANHASKVAWDTKTFRQFYLHKLVYRELREKFGLPAQIAVRVIAKVADAYKTQRKKQAKFKALGALAFDRKNYTLFPDKGIVSLSTLQGRIKIPFVCGERQRELLQCDWGEADLVHHKGIWCLFVTVQVEEPPPEVFEQANGWLGVDLGIVNLATTSDGESYTGEAIRRARRRYSRLRRILQQVGTQNARRHLKRLSGKEADFVRTVNHTIAKRIVEKARRHSLGIALEDLSCVREATVRVRKGQRYLHTSWSFHKLQQFIEYKAKLAGVPVVAVDPRYTSQTCPVCLHVDRRNRPSQAEFRCAACGYRAQADVVAARNIATRAAVNQPIAGDYALRSQHGRTCKLPTSVGSR